MTHARRNSMAAHLVVAVLVSVTLAGCAGSSVPGVLRLGYFPNLTHAQALYGLSTGLYEHELGETRIRTTVFNAGPSVLEALLSHQVDVIYVGPSPTINALEKTGLDVVVIIAGSASGGAMFVVREDIELEDNASFANKRFATPQLGNTQDVALKHYLQERGHRTRDKGGQVDVINAANPDILSLFQQRQIDGAWLPEPWATRLVLEGGGRVHVNESDTWPDGKFVTTHVVTTRKFLNERPDDVEKLVAAHVEATRRIQTGGDEVLAAINDGIEDATGKRLADATIEAAFPNIEFTSDPLRDTFIRQYEMSHDLGFSKRPPDDIERAYDLRFVTAEATTASSE